MNTVPRNRVYGLGDDFGGFDPSSDFTAGSIADAGFDPGAFDPATFDSPDFTSSGFDVPGDFSSSGDSIGPIDAGGYGPLGTGPSDYTGFDTPDLGTILEGGDWSTYGGYNDPTDLNEVLAQQATDAMASDNGFTDLSDAIDGESGTSNDGGIFPSVTVGLGGGGSSGSGGGGKTTSAGGSTQVTVGGAGSGSGSGVPAAAAPAKSPTSTATILGLGALAFFLLRR